jgi:hypothetical protein
VLYYDTEAQRQLIREHTEQLAEDVRRARQVKPEGARHANWIRLAAEVRGRAERLRRRKDSHAPAYDA